MMQLKNRLQIYRSPILDVLRSIESSSIDAVIAKFPPPRSPIYPYLSHVVATGREFKRVLKDPSWLYVVNADYCYNPPVKLNEKDGDRYQSKREQGIGSVRKDGSQCSRENDVLAAAAERLVVEQLGRQFDSQIYWHGDSADCYLHGAKVDIKLRRRDGDDVTLLVNPSDKQKDVYILVSGSHKNNLVVWGYTTHQELTTSSRANFGYGKKLAMNCRELHPIDDLLELTAHPKPNEPLLLPYRIASRLQSDGWWIHGYNEKFILLSPSRYVPHWGKSFSCDGIIQQLPVNSSVLVFGDEEVAQALSESNKVIWVELCGAKN